MKQRHVSFTRTAQGHVTREKAWWLENRDHTEVFADELEQALKVVAILPGAGTPYQRSIVSGVRRIFLRRTALHLYYTFDDNQVIVRALWGAHRSHGPQL